MAHKVFVDELMERIRSQVRTEARSSVPSAGASVLAKEEPVAANEILHRLSQREPERVATAPIPREMPEFTGVRVELETCINALDKFGEVNPRHPGFVNDRIQNAKGILRRTLVWYTRPLRVFHTAIIRTLQQLLATVETQQAYLGGCALKTDIENVESANARLEEVEIATSHIYEMTVSASAESETQLRKLHDELESVRNSVDVLQRELQKPVSRLALPAAEQTLPTNGPNHRQPTDQEIIDRRFPLDGELEEQIDCAASPEQLARLLGRVHRSWEFLGETNAYHSVLTWDKFTEANLAQHKHEFLETGKGDVERLRRWMVRNGLPVNPVWTCLEYGCGTGRVTRHLAQVFRSVVAYDISEPHLELARQDCADAIAQGRVTFHRVADLSSLDYLPEVNIVFSVIVLQTNPPPIIALILDKLLARLRRGGVAYFQVPTFCRGYSFRLDEYLEERVDVPRMETHVLPQRIVFELLAKSGCGVVETQPDNMLGTMDYVSTTFLVQKY